MRNVIFLWLLLLTGLYFHDRYELLQLVETREQSTPEARAAADAAAQEWLRERAAARASRQPD